MASELGCKSNLGYSISDIFFVVVLDQVASLSTLYRLVQLASSSLKRCTSSYSFLCRRLCVYDDVISFYTFQIARLSIRRFLQRTRL